MRYESSVTSLSWIPSEAVSGMTKLPFEMGIGHYDPPPPDVLGDLEALRQADAFRFANELRAWVEVEDGHIVGYGQEGGGRIGSTTMRLGRRTVTFAAVPFPDLRPEPEATPTSVRFVQTAGGRTGAPAPRHVRRKPFVQVTAPVAWSTLSLTLRADGNADFELLGASPFPRHWVYDGEGRLALKTGMIDFAAWWSRDASADHTPWGDEDSPAFVTVAETAVERELSRTIMGAGRKPRIRRIDAGETLVRQGEEGSELFVLLDGVLGVEVDGEDVAEVGPGAIVGERAVLEGRRRTSTLRAVTPCKVAVADAGDVDREAVAEVAGGHRREDDRP